MTLTAGEIAKSVGAQVVGNADLQISGVASIGNARAGDLVFVEEAKHLDSALGSQAAAVIAGNFADNSESEKTVLIVSNPRLAFTRAARLLSPNSADRGGIHATSAVHKSAKLGEDVSIGAHAVVGEGVIVGEHTCIGASCVLGANVRVGANCEMFANVTIYPGTRIGNRVIVHAGAVLGSDGFGYVRPAGEGMDVDGRSHTGSAYEKFPQIGSLEIEDDVEIGANTTIDRGALERTRIGRGTKIDNLVHIGHNCVIGENVIIAAQAGFSGSITIEDNAVIGGQVGVGEHARIQEGVLLGGQAGVLPRKVLRGKGVAFWGTPAKPLREYLKSLAALARLGKQE